MILAWLLAATAAPAAAAPAAIGPPAPLQEATRALEAGRRDQARIMISHAVAQGSRGPVVDRLLADLAFADGRFGEASSRYAVLAIAAPGDPLLAERAGLAAFKAGDAPGARKWIEHAAAIPAASWRTWNALGVLADRRGDFAAADAAYAKARELSPNEAEVLNNIGWSHILRRKWETALLHLEQARALNVRSKRIANNLELAKAALAEDLPARRPGEDDEAWSARLNDAGVAAQLTGDQARAVAAFTRAIEARPVWYDRAADTLKRAQATR